MEPRAGVNNSAGTARGTIGTELECWEFTVPGKLIGKIVAFSSQGNLVSDLTANLLRAVPRDHRVTIRCDEHETNGLFEGGHDQPEATFIAVLGVHGKLELEIVGDSAKLMLGVPLGETVEVEWS